MKKLKITLTRSLIGFKKDQRATVRALGLGKIGTSVVQEDNPHIAGFKNGILIFPGPPEHADSRTNDSSLL